ncbi:sulfatase [Candidatus Daviesbacteria bacterium]|nr:sulfatase [Candidatus Daviesbacteria bacterium]
MLGYKSFIEKIIRNQQGFAPLLALGIGILIIALAISSSVIFKKGFNAILPAPASAGAATASTQPNIIVLMSDDQTNAMQASLPKINSLIRDQGTNFTNFFTTNSLCCPSRATFLSGQFSHNSGVWDDQAPYNYSAFDNTKALPVWLQSFGYTTAHFGKYLNGYAPTSKNLSIPNGWDEFYGGVGNTIYSYWGYQLIEKNATQSAKIITYPKDNPSNPTWADKYYQVNLVASKAVDFINRHASDTKPYFMWVAMFAPHEGGPGTNGATPSHAHAHDFDTAALPQNPNYNEADVSDKPSMIQSLPLLTSSDTTSIRARWRNSLDAIQSEDDATNNIINALTSTGKLNNTIVIFTTDNGYFYGEHRKPKGKILNYQESVHLPWMMRGPGIPIQSLNALTGAVDWTSTILDYAQVPSANITRTLDGMSVKPLIENPSTPWRDVLLIEATTKEFYQVIAQEFTNGAITKNWSYAEHTTSTTNPNELYDEITDPWELTNLMYTNASVLDPKIINALNQLKTCNQSGGVSCTSVRFNPLPTPTPTPTFTPTPLPTDTPTPLPTDTPTPLPTDTPTPTP